MEMKNGENQKGFTLIELLIVIAIIAILAVVVVLTLNPEELLRQARDSNRVSDFATLTSGLGLYAEDVSTSTPMYGSADDLYTANPTMPSASASVDYFTGSANWGFSTGTTNTYSAIVTSTSVSVNGTGWIPVNFAAISSGAPFGSLPLDPVNSGQLMYIYAATSTSYKLAAKMESQKYGYGGSADVISNDGGVGTSTYQQGTNLEL